MKTAGFKEILSTAGKNIMMVPLFIWGTLLVSSCNEDWEDVFDNDAAYIDIMVTDETSIALTRAAYAGLTTTFENGDEIGLYAVDGTTAIHSNIKFTLTDGKWVADTKVPWKDTYTYYAYYPYTASPASPDFAAAGDETAKFASMISGWTIREDQGTLDKFRANDLMMATGVNTSGQSVNFTMKHKMALAVVNSETVTFSYTSDPSTKYNTAFTFDGNIPYFDGTNYYLFLRPNTETTIGGQKLKAGAGNYITGSGGKLTESYTLTYSTDGGETFTSTRPSWLTNVVKSETSDPANFECSVANTKTTDIVKRTTTSEGNFAYSPDALRNATTVSNIDLSKRNNDGSVRSKRTTANCYLVHAPGTYKIPLVYGNAIKNDATNSLAYKATVTADNIRANLVNHNDEDITNPWIKNNGITVNAAELIWQDANGLISKVGISGNYLTFTVPKNTITAGNAVIAAKSGSDIVWSWHIWVTEETLAPSTLTSIDTGSHTNLNGDPAPYKVAPVSVGWVTTSSYGNRTETVYAGSTCVVKITCANGSYWTFTVTQPDCVIESFDLKRWKGYNPYYQWGRKDPLIPAAATGGSGSYNHDTWDISGTLLTSSANNTVYSFVSGSYSVGTTIRNPITHYYNSSNKGPYGELPYYYNYWDINNNALDNITTATNKTIYDPCPPDFCVPTQNLYAFMGTAGKNDKKWSNDCPGKTWETRYNTSSTTGPNLFFPNTGQRIHSSGSAYTSSSASSCWSSSMAYENGAYLLYAMPDMWSYTFLFPAYGLPVRPVAEE